MDKDIDPKWLESSLNLANTSMWDTTLGEFGEVLHITRNESKNARKELVDLLNKIKSIYKENTKQLKMELKLGMYS